MSKSRLRSSLFLLAMCLPLTACGATKMVGNDDDLDNDGGTGSEGGSDWEIGGEGGPGPTLSGLELTPSNAVVTIDTTTSPPTRAVQNFIATLNLADGTSKDVSSSATFTLDDPTLGSFAGATFTSTDTLPGGKLGITTIVRAEAEGKSGAANLTIIQLRKTGDKRDFFFTVPYMGTPDPAKDVLKFGTNIKQVDVAFNMDTTGSMSGSITNLRNALANTTTGIFPKLKAAIPSVGLAVVDHRDYPVCGHGSSGDFPVRVHQIVTTDLAKAISATSKYSAAGGADGSESQIPSMWHILTGGALNWSGGTVAKHVPAAGTFGGVDFRPGSLPVVVLITDITWHDIASTAYDGPYCSSVLSPPTLAMLKTEFTKANARFVDVTSGAENQANELSDATKSNIVPAAFGAGCPAGQCPTGVSGACRAATGPGGSCRLNFQSTYSGTGVSDSIVKAIQAISVGSQFDVTAVPSNDPTNAPGEDGAPVDAVKFIKALRAMEEGDPANGCPPQAAKDADSDGVKDTFTAVKVGTPVCFEVLPQMNTTVKPKAEAQFFNAFIDVLGMPGSVKLDRRTVLFLVPPREITAK